ncbi:MAG: YbjN domain-containing protein [Eggerthellaceae bacterium]|nr:YbjN domain-containing protein [Eggerthellaceae bacterium]
MPDVKEQVNLVERAMVERGLKFDHVDEYDNPMISLSFGGGDFSYTHVAIHLVFDLDGESAQVVTSPIANAPGEKTSKMLLILNECNHKFRWVKFYLDNDNDVVANGDVIFNEQNAGEACIELVMRTASIIDDAYPEIMKGIWG